MTISFLCLISYYLFRVGAYALASRYIQKTPEGSVCNWALSVLVRSGKKWSSVIMSRGQDFVYFYILCSHSKKVRNYLLILKGRSAVSHGLRAQMIKG